MGRVREGWIMRNWLFSMILTVILAWVAPVWAAGTVVDGLYLIYQPKQAIVSLETIRGLERDGVAFEYYENGDVKQLTNYQAGKLHGSDKTFYQDGKVLCQKEFKDGKLEGMVSQFYPNGKPKIEMFYINNTPHGDAKYYSEDGTLKQITTYRLGRVLNIKKYGEAGAVEIETLF